MNNKIENIIQKEKQKIQTSFRKILPAKNVLFRELRKEK